MWLCVLMYFLLALLSVQVCRGRIQFLDEYINYDILSCIQFYLLTIIQFFKSNTTYL